MKTIIAGSRLITTLAEVEQAIAASGIRITEVVSGCAPGVDRLGAQWAARHNIPVRSMPALWSTHGRSAGMIRNQQMAQAAEALIAVWDGQSVGTRHMIEIAQKRGLKVYIHTAGDGASKQEEFAL